MGYKSMDHAADEFVRENKIKNAEAQKRRQKKKQVNFITAIEAKAPYIDYDEMKTDFIAAIEANYINYDEIIDIESNGVWIDREDENFDDGRMEFIEI